MNTRSTFTDANKSVQKHSSSFSDSESGAESDHEEVFLYEQTGINTLPCSLLMPTCSRPEDELDPTNNEAVTATTVTHPPIQSRAPYTQPTVTTPLLAGSSTERLNPPRAASTCCGFSEGCVCGCLVCMTITLGGALLTYVCSSALFACGTKTCASTPVSGNACVFFNPKNWVAPAKVVGHMSYTECGDCFNSFSTFTLFACGNVTSLAVGVTAGAVVADKYNKQPDRPVAPTMSINDR